MGSPESMSAQQQVSAIADLAGHVAEAIRTLEPLTERTDPEMRPRLEAMVGLHASHLERLDRALGELGGSPVIRTAPAGALDRAAAVVRCMIGAFDRDTLDTAIETEERLLHAYSAASLKLTANPALRRMVAGQRDELRRRIATLRP